VSARSSDPTREPSEILARFHAELDLVELNARQVARRIATSSITMDDLRSFGREGLLLAARSFDASHGVPFRRWANLKVRGAIIDGVRQYGQLPRRVYQELRAMAAADRLQEGLDEEACATPAQTAEAADARLTSHLTSLATAMAMGTMAEGPALDESERPAGPEELALRSELLTRVKAVISSLPDAERTLIERHYFGDETLDQAAASMGLSRSWGSRLHARAIERIARAMRKEA
jgi:RNA polymerase sigma factor for flagellar operon FliA